MADDKPLHVPRGKYPELMYPNVVAPPPINLMRDEDDSVHLLDYWRVIVSRRWTVMAVLFTVVVITVIWTFKQTPIYRAQTSLQIDRENPNVLSFKDVYEIESSTDDTLRTQFEVLKSRLLARRVIQNLHLETVEELQPTQKGTPSLLKTIREYFQAPRAEDSDPLRPIIDEYLERLVVAPVRQARIVSVSFDSKDPQLASRIMNAHAEAYIEQNFQYRWEATQKASAFLKEQLVGLRQNLEKAEDRLAAYSRDNHILFTEEGKNSAIEKLQQLETEYTKAQSDRFLKESYDRLVSDGNTDALPQIEGSDLVTSLTTQLAQLQREESELAVTFSPDYPTRKRKRSQIEEVNNTIGLERLRIVRTIRAEYAAALDRERLARETLEKQRELVNLLNQDIIQYNILKREVDSEQQVHNGLLTRLNEAGVSANLRASNIRILDGAEAPREPISPRKALNIALSVMVGLIFGIGLAFFQEYMDDTIKAPDDIDNYLSLPTLGLVPKLGSLSTRGYGYGYLYGGQRGSREVALAEPRLDLIAHEAPASVMAEAYRSIRTSLLLSSPDHPPKSVVVTSATPSEGKTVTAVNVAISLTQTGARVVLVDADMRKPRVHSIFGMKTDSGLSSVLTGTATLNQAIQECSVPNLFILPCGPLPPNPGELIVAERFQQLMRILPQYFDFVIIDSPPMSNVSDSRMLAAKCDATILVVKALSTSRHQARGAVDHLHEARARVAGVVLNDLDVRSAGSYYSYYYSKYSYSPYVTGDTQKPS